MLRTWLLGAWNQLQTWLRRFQRPESPAPAAALPSPAPGKSYRPLRRIVLTDSVGRTLFDDFAAHRRTDRGDEEIGWVLLGLREEDEAIALATLPAGTQRSAGVAHVRFNSEAQALGSRILRQWDKRLTLLGVVHTHPGSLRHPSQGDFQGDSRWVGQLRGGEGVFGIGTADVRQPAAGPLAQPGENHQQILGELLFSWYALAHGEQRYRKIPVHLMLGPDLAKPLHPLWPALEEHAEALDRLARQQQGAAFQVLAQKTGPALSLKLPLAEPDASLQVVLDTRETRYFVHQGRDVSAVDPEEEKIDRAVYLILAELAQSFTRDPDLANRGRMR